MGGRGGSSGSGGGGGGARNATSEKAYSKEVYNEILSKGLNSKIPGIRTKAENGTGNYSFKGATPVTYEEALKMGRTANVVTREENTLVSGYLPNGKHVYFAAKTNSQQIQTLMEQRRSKTDTTANVPDRANTTTTYDRWQKNNRKKFDDWYFGGQNQKNKK